MTDILFAKSHRASDERVSIKPDLSLPDVLSASGIEFGAHAKYSFAADAGWDPKTLAYGLTRLELTASTESRIGTVWLHSLSAPDILQAVVRFAMPADVSAAIGRKDKQEYLDLKTGRLTDDLLREVGRRAAVSRALMGTPNREVMECFDVPQRTATHWIARARQAGFLD